MVETALTTENLLKRAKSGDELALGSLFALHRDQLRRTIRLRLDRPMYGRLDPSDGVPFYAMQFIRG